VSGIGNDVDVPDIHCVRATVFRPRLRKVHLWAHGAEGTGLDAPQVSRARPFTAVESIVERGRLPTPGQTDAGTLDVSDMPDEPPAPLRAYPREFAGSDPTHPFDNQRSSVPSEHHGFVVVWVKRDRENYFQ
jgi:hypothetical protein